MDHAEFVGNLWQVLPEFGHPVAAVSDLPERPWRFQQVATLGKLDLALREWERFPVEFLQTGLVVKKVHMRGPAVHEEENNPARPGGKEGLGPKLGCSPGLLRK